MVQHVHSWPWLSERKKDFLVATKFYCATTTCTLSFTFWLFCMYFFFETILVFLCIGSMISFAFSGGGGTSCYIVWVWPGCTYAPYRTVRFRIIGRLERHLVSRHWDWSEKRDCGRILRWTVSDANWVHGFTICMGAQESWARLLCFCNGHITVEGHEINSINKSQFFQTFKHRNCAYSDLQLAHTSIPFAHISNHKFTFLMVLTYWF